MRDIAVLLFLIACIGASLRRAWYGVLALAVFSYLSPHTYCWGFMRAIPAYKILIAAVFLSFLNDPDRQRIPKDWRIPTFFFLWAYFFFTTLFATNPDWAWLKLEEVSKVYAPFILTLTLINTRKKLFALTCTIAASIGIVAVKGGIWSILHGFHYRVYGPPFTNYYDNNDFAVATNVALPLLILWMREAKGVWTRRALMVAIPLCICSALASWSRGGLLSLSATLAFLIWNSKRKWLAVPLLIVGIYLVTPMLPKEWFARMHTIQTYQQDASAQGRLEAWRDGIQWAQHHPFTGCGFEGWRYVTQRDWHSSYVQILAEHGFIAFAIWFSLLLGTFVSLTRLPRLTRHVSEMRWVENYALMIRASLVAYAAGTAFLGLSYWDLFYHIVFLAVLLRTFALEELVAHQTEESALPHPSPELGFGATASSWSHSPRS